jgi:hypothetical protein
VEKIENERVVKRASEHRSSHTWMLLVEGMSIGILPVLNF